MSKELPTPTIKDWKTRAAAEWKSVESELLGRDAKVGEILAGVYHGLESIKREVWQGRGTLKTPTHSANYGRTGVSLKADYLLFSPETIRVDERGRDLKLIGISERTESVELAAEVHIPQPNGDNAYTITPFLFRFGSTPGAIELAALRDFEIRSALPKDKKEEGVIYASGDGSEKRLEILFRNPVKHAVEIARFFDGAMLGYVMAGESPDFESQERLSMNYRSILLAKIGHVGSFDFIYGLGKSQRKGR